MQTLQITQPDPETGDEKVVKRKVVRSWHTADGREVYLHADGTYGQKNGLPVMSASDLDVIDDARQLRAAQAWWESAGKRRAAAVYDSAAADPARDNDEYVLYFTYAGKRPKDPGPGISFREAGFPVRPSWWGPAAMIDLGGTVYERVPESDAGVTDGTPPLSKTDGVKDTLADF